MSILVETHGHARKDTPIVPRLSNALSPTNPQLHFQNSHTIVQTIQSTTTISSAGDSQTNQNNGAFSNLHETPKVNVAVSTPAPTMPRVPQVHKASLVRFLEKCLMSW